MVISEVMISVSCLSSCGVNVSSAHGCVHWPCLHCRRAHGKAAVRQWHGVWTVMLAA